jgi:hypothetical protein
MFSDILLNGIKQQQAEDRRFAAGERLSVALLRQRRNAAAELRFERRQQRRNDGKGRRFARNPA